MAEAPFGHEVEPAVGRTWRHILGKCLLVAALVVGAGIPLLMWLLLSISTFSGHGTVILFN